MFDDSTSPRGATHSSLPASAPDSSPALAVPPAVLLTFFERLEHLPAEGTGMVVFGAEETPVGRILLEHGRVCWAAARTMRSRLTDLLRHQRNPPLDAERIEQAYAECVESRRTFGEYLVESGVVSAPGMRRALRQHIAESIALLSDPNLVSRWFGRDGKLYDARFTFSTGELLTNLGALWDMDAAMEATARLNKVATSATCLGLAFVRSPAGDVLPVAQRHAEAASAGVLLSLAHWVDQLPDAIPSHFGPTRFASYRCGDGRTALTWNEGRVGYAVVCNAPSALSQVVSRVLSVC